MCETDMIDADEELVRSLLREQHPDLADLPLREVAAGWGNQMWRLGEELAVRLPRTPSAAGDLRKEQRWLPALAPGLPLPVPVPVRIGLPSARFPRPWTVATWVPGEPGDRASITRGRHAAGRLAVFLRELHRVAPAGAPIHHRRGVPLRSVAAEFETHVRNVAGSDVADGARAVWEQAVAAGGWQGRPVGLHGDLHPANVVISGGTLAGVIDFGELCAGDPATDLAAAWLLLPTGVAPSFFAAYGHVDEAMIRRARGWAVVRGLSLVGIGRAWDRGLPGGQPTWGRAGWAALRRVLACERVGDSTGRS
ncbi:aminoglycoside phosphotransferase family protein [Streptomyces sp. Edi4]|uniref:aminoglycoside phosphotransferase family protein n=1 Tax=Streptomyces sp. Edi4 TaxID=3162527 RepID=UPI0033061285